MKKFSEYVQDYFESGKEIYEKAKAEKSILLNPTRADFLKLDGYYIRAIAIYKPKQSLIVWSEPSLLHHHVLDQLGGVSDKVLLDIMKDENRYHLSGSGKKYSDLPETKEELIKKLKEHDQLQTILKNYNFS